MPNWCSNRLYLNGPPETSKAEVIRVMDNSGFTELLAHGVHTARALFLLVFHGCIRVDGHLYGREPLNWMTQYGGARVNLNVPVDDEASELVGLLTGGFDKEKLGRLVAFGLSRKFFDTVDQLDAAIVGSTCWERAAALLRDVYFDYRCDSGYQNPGGTPNEVFFKWLNYYYEDHSGPVVDRTEKHYYHTMLEVIPPKVLPEINGFNGEVRKPSGSRMSDFANRTSSYGSYVSTYGTKWPGFEFTIGEQDGRVFIDFDTAWSPPNEDYYDALSERLPSLDRIYYAENGVGYCGSGVVLAPGTTLWKQSSLDMVYDEANDDAIVVESVKPEWIVDRVGHYGG